MAVLPALFSPCRLFLVSVVATAIPLGLGAQSPTQPAHHIVTIKMMQFQPRTLNVKSGDTVEWKNEDIFSHTATANDGSFDSGLIAPGSSWQTTIRKTGTIAYHCRPHPNMTAEIISQQPGGHEQQQHGQTQGTGEGQTDLRWVPPKRPDEFHPILVNFTAALLPLAFLSDLLGRLLRRQALHATGLWMITYEAVITPLTAIAG